MEEILDATRLSLVVALCSTLLTVPLGLVLSTLLYGSKWRPIEVVFLFPLLLPPTVTGFLILWSFSPLHSVGAAVHRVSGDIVFTWVGTVLACVVVSFPLAFQACMVGHSRVRSELIESALVLGGSRLLNTFRVVLPQMKGAVFAAGLLVFARAMGEFGASMMVGGNIAGRTQTLPLAVYSFAEVGNFEAAAWCTLVACLVGLFVYFSLRLIEMKVKTEP
jgi:molybdate transport system permease protein